MHTIPDSAGTARGALLRPARKASGRALLFAAIAFAHGLAAAQDGPVAAPTERAEQASDARIATSSLLPVPLLITEPAVGYGLGAALLRFGGSSAGEAGPPPDIGGIAAFKTENGSRGVGAGYTGNLLDDRIRYAVGAGKAYLNLDVYGAEDVARRFSLDAPLFSAQVFARVRDTRWFAGLRFQYLASTVRFDVPAELPPIGEGESDIGLLALVLQYDSRDNTLTPSRGVYAESAAGFARGAFGSSTNFESGHVRGYGYWPIGTRTVLGLRGDLSYANGEVPFYAAPYVSLRGIPALRYQGRRALVGEIEVRQRLGGRWAVVGFGGAGRAYGERRTFAEAETRLAGGAGVRYLFAPKLGLYVGLDVARGPEDLATYVQVGSAWR